MRQSELLIAFSKLTPAQRNRIEKELVMLIDRNQKLESAKPEICPICGCSHENLVKRGKQNGKQRWTCKECGHKFTYDSHTITSHLKIEQSVFLEICMDTLCMVPIKQTASKLNVSVHCVFTNRHKFLCLLEQILDAEDIQMSDIIEGDEKYVHESVKGTPPVNRKARHRGEPCSRRGISREQICIVTTTDRNGHEIFKAVGSAKPTNDIITETLSTHITKESILYVDGLTSYDVLQEKKVCEVRHLAGHCSYNKVEHINTVNQIHSMIEEKLARYRGIATKYMNRYMALFVFMRRFMNLDDCELSDALIDTIQRIGYAITRKRLKTEHLFNGYADIPLKVS